MKRYPTIVIAQHETGGMEKFNLSVVAATPQEAMEEAYNQFDPRYPGQDGWRVVVLVDQLMASEEPTTEPAG